MTGISSEVFSQLSHVNYVMQATHSYAFRMSIITMNFSFATAVSRFLCQNMLSTSTKVTADVLSHFMIKHKHISNL